MTDGEQSHAIEEVLFGAAPGRAATVDARLVVVAGRASQAEVPLSLPAVLGRGPEATVLVTHPTVSRTHCEVVQVNGELVVRDRDSKNGTFVNGKRVREAVLRPGDTLSVGPLTFRALYEQPAPEATPSAASDAGAADQPVNGAPPKSVSDDDIDFFLTDGGSA